MEQNVLGKTVSFIMWNSGLISKYIMLPSAVTHSCLYIQIRKYHYPQDLRRFYLSGTCSFNHSLIQFTQYLLHSKYRAYRIYFTPFYFLLLLGSWPTTLFVPFLGLLTYSTVIHAGEFLLLDSVPALTRDC